jgi:hypothetical protein
MTSLRTVIISFLGIFTLHIVATVFHWYWYIKWLDVPMHFLGGFISAVLFFWLFGRALPHFVHLYKHFAVTLIFVLGWCALIGVLWEFFEFGLDFFFIPERFAKAFEQAGVADTMADLFMDLIGGTTFALITKVRYNKKKARDGKNKTISVDNHSNV